MRYVCVGWVSRTLDHFLHRLGGILNLILVMYSCETLRGNYDITKREITFGASKLNIMTLTTKQIPLLLEINETADQATLSNIQ